MRTLLYCYLCDYYGRDFKVQGVNLPDSPIDPGEYDEPFGDDYYPSGDEPKSKITENRFELPEFAAPEKEKQCYYTHITFPMKRFVSIMKKQDSSPAILLSILMSQAIERVHPEHEGEIVTNLVWNFRNEINMKNTHNYCVSGVALTYSDRIKRMPLELQGTCFRGMTFAQTRESDAYRIANGLIALRKKCEQTGSYAGKLSVLSFLDKVKANTFPLSYTGQMALGECEKKIRDMYIMPTGTYVFGIEVASVNDSLSIDMQKNRDVSVYEDALCDILGENSIPYSRQKTVHVVFPETNNSMVMRAKEQR